MPRKLITWKSIQITIIVSLFWLVVHAFFMWNSYCLFSTSNTNLNGEKVLTDSRPPQPSSLSEQLHVKLIAKPNYPEFRHEEPSGKVYYVAGQGLLYQIPKDIGEHGDGVTIPPELTDLSNKMYTENEFNLLASNLISLTRSLEDSRDSKCASQQFPDDLPNTSVIIVFHNEAWTTLLRTVHSVILRSPRKLLKEIILVDDASEKEHLKLPLEKYVSGLTVPVHILRMSERSGLVQARLKGAATAVGDTLTFLDAHCEARPGWLEPLLMEIRKNRRAVVCPIIDVIDADTFQYKNAVHDMYGGFDWSLTFRWYSIPPEHPWRITNDPSMPIKTPTMAGGLFTIDKNHFYQIGSYDSEMKTWGGENIEMSFRVWMCGGEVLIHPCSGVGHVFRKKSPYSWPGGVHDTLLRNNLRIVHVWMDHYKEFYLQSFPDARSHDFGDIRSRLAIRRQCPHNFTWYIENIYADSPIPSKYYSLGKVRNPISGLCLDTKNRKSGEDVALSKCINGVGNRQTWTYTAHRELRNQRLCIDIYSPPHSTAKLVDCHRNGGNQSFDYNRKTGEVKHSHSDMCLTVNKRNALILSKCAAIPEQRWILESYSGNILS